MLKPDEFYKACNLKENPFQDNPAVASHERAAIWVGYEAENRKLVRLLKQARSDYLGSTRFFLMYGSYGTGKSHAFLWAQNLILHQEKEDYNSCVYFIHSLKTTGGKFSFHRAFQEYVVNQSDLLADIAKYRSTLHAQVERYKDEFAKPDDTSESVIIGEIFKSPQLVNLAIQIYSANDPASQKNVVTVSDDFDSIIRFTNLVKLFTFNVPSDSRDDNRFKKAVYLFIDELDDLLGAPPKDGRIVNDWIRHLYDSCQGCFGLGLAISAELSELSAYFLDYVLTRIDRTIELSLLDKDQALDFIKQMLGTARITKDDSFYPFTDESIDNLLDQLVSLTPRKIVKALYESIEHIRLGDFKPSPKKMVTVDVLDELGVLEDLMETL